MQLTDEQVLEMAEQAGLHFYATSDDATRIARALIEQGRKMGIEFVMKAIYGARNDDDN